MKIEFEFKPDKKDFDFLDEKLLEFNCSKVDNYSYENFVIKICNDTDMIIGGIHGQIGGGWLYIASLWVDGHYRGQGIGKKLLFLAEQSAAEKNCHASYLYTYSFQSPKFYEKFGYIIMSTLENYCGEHTKYYMKKELS